MAGPIVSAYPVSTPTGERLARPEDQPFGLGSQDPLSIGQRLLHQTQVPVSLLGLPTKLGASLRSMITQETLVVEFGDAVNYRLYRLQMVNPMRTNWEQEHILDLSKKIRGVTFVLKILMGPIRCFSHLPASYP